MDSNFDPTAVPLGDFSQEPATAMPVPTEDQMREAARKQIKEQLTRDRIMAEERASLEPDEISELERTDTDDLFSPTDESPKDELERDDVDDVLGGGDEEGESIDDLLNPDLSDVFDVKTEDIMGEAPKRKPRIKRLRTLRRPPPATGLQGVGW